MIKLLNKSSIDTIPKITGQLFNFFEHYFGMSFEIDPKKMLKSHEDIIIHTKIHPIIR